MLFLSTVKLQRSTELKARQARVAAQQGWSRLSAHHLLDVLH